MGNNSIGHFLLAFDKLPLALSWHKVTSKYLDSFEQLIICLTVKTL